MPPDPRPRFLFRASALLLVLLTVWWFVLLKPLLTEIQDVVRWAFHPTVADIVSTPDGGWDALVGDPDLGTLRVHFNSQVINQPTLCLPLFWALILSVWRRGKTWRTLLSGTVLFLLWSNLAVLFACWIEMILGTDVHGFAWRQADVVLILNQWVLPILGPVVVVLLSDTGLRDLLFTEASVSVAAQRKLQTASTPRRG